MAGRGRGRGHPGPHPPAQAYAHPGYGYAQQYAVQQPYYYMQGPGGQVMAAPAQQMQMQQHQAMQFQYAQQQHAIAAQQAALMRQQPGQQYGQPPVAYTYVQAPNGQYMAMQTNAAAAYQVQMGQQMAAGQQAAHSPATTPTAQGQMQMRAAQPVAAPMNPAQMAYGRGVLNQSTQLPNQPQWQQNNAQFPPATANGRPKPAPSAQSANQSPRTYDPKRTVLINEIPSRDPDGANVQPGKTLGNLFGLINQRVGTFHMKTKAMITNGACYIELDNEDQKNRLVSLYKTNPQDITLYGVQLTVTGIDTPVPIPAGSTPGGAAAKPQPAAKPAKGATPRSSNSRLSVNAAEFSMGGSVNAAPFVPTKAATNPPLPTPAPTLTMPSLERGESKSPMGGKGKAPPAPSPPPASSPTGSTTSGKGINVSAKPFKPATPVATAPVAAPRPAAKQVEAPKLTSHATPNLKKWQRGTGASALDTSAIDENLPTGPIDESFKRGLDFDASSDEDEEPAPAALDTSAIDGGGKGNMNMAKGDLKGDISKGRRQPVAKAEIRLERAHSEPDIKGERAETSAGTAYEYEREDEKTTSTVEHRVEQAAPVDAPNEARNDDATLEVEDDEDNLSEVEEDNFATDDTRRRHTMNYLWTFRKRYQGDEQKPKQEEVERMAKADIFVPWLQVNQFVKEMLRNKKYEKLNDRGPGSGGKKIEKSAFQLKMEKERDDPTKQLKRKSHGILNKMCPDKYEKLSTRLQEVMNEFVYDANDAQVVVAGIFQKACLMPQYVELYADLAAELNHFCPARLKNENQEDLNKIFRRQILNCCQQQFESGFDQEAGITQHFTEPEKLIQRTKNKKKMFGNIQFIACLFIRHLVKEALVHKHIIPQLLQHRSEQPDAVSMHVEAVCVLLESCGAQLDHEKARRHIDAYVKRLQKLAKSCGTRIQFRVEGLEGLRNKGWPKTEAMKTAKTIKDFRKDEEDKERQRRQQEIRQKERDRMQGKFGRSGGRGGGRFGNQRQGHRNQRGNQSRREAPQGQWVAAKGRKQPAMRRTKSLGDGDRENMNEFQTQGGRRRRGRRQQGNEQRQQGDRRMTNQELKATAGRRMSSSPRGQPPPKAPQRQPKKQASRPKKNTPVNRFAAFAALEENSGDEHEDNEPTPAQRQPEARQSPPKDAERRRPQRGPAAPSAPGAPKPMDLTEYKRKLGYQMKEYFLNSNAKTLYYEFNELEQKHPDMAGELGNPLPLILDCAFDTRGGPPLKALGDLLDYLQQQGYFGETGVRDGLSAYLEYYSSMVMDNPNLAKMLAPVLLRTCSFGALDPAQLKAWLDGNTDAGIGAKDFVKTNNKAHARAQSNLLAELVRGLNDDEQLAEAFLVEGCTVKELLDRWHSQVSNDDFDVEQWITDKDLSAHRSHIDRNRK